ncbi:MAG: glycosyltransferase family 2 protein [Pseudomonadales bacterium]|nr:glycosyltransferase family 2 protein [Pseudomonadales bacterium]
MNKIVDVSIIIPLMNEEGSLNELYDQITETMTSLGKAYEIIFIDDGSTDGSYDIIRNLHESDKRVEVIKFRGNFGKASGLQAGFNAARGNIIITMDADLQDSPKEIPRFLSKLDEGYDIVSGWKKKRHDPKSKTGPSKLYNWVTRRISGIEIHDFNCGFKAYRREVFDHVELYGELHRYIPVLAGWKGYKVTEIVVEHQPRVHGESKYGWERLGKGMLDLITIYFTRKYAKRPLHIFGGLGLVCFMIGSLALTYLSVLWLFDAGPIGNRPLLFFGILSILFGGQLLSFGILAEMLAMVDNRFSEPYVVSKQLFHSPNALKRENSDEAERLHQ